MPDLDLYLKLEFYNPTGSVKDRAAAYILKRLTELGIINSGTTIVESSSGNFGIALSVYCKKLGLKFCCVIDPNISPINETIIRKLASQVIKVTERDSSGGYMLRRIEKVKEILANVPGSYWINQYANPYNAEAYQSLGGEICNDVENIDYVFIGVSSGGTITGASIKIKEKMPSAKVIAVDVEGSCIFGGTPKKRYIPGIGSGLVPEILKFAKIDDVVIVDEASSVIKCHELLMKYAIFAGGSSGTVYAGINKYFSNREINRKIKVVAIFPDRGDRYANTVYNEEWCHQHFTITFEG